MLSRPTEAPIPLPTRPVVMRRAARRPYHLDRSSRRVGGRAHRYAPPAWPVGYATPAAEVENARNRSPTSYGSGGPGRKPTRSAEARRAANPTQYHAEDRPKRRIILAGIEAGPRDHRRGRARRCRRLRFQVQDRLFTCSPRRRPSPPNAAGGDRGKTDREVGRALGPRLGPKTPPINPLSLRRGGTAGSQDEPLVEPCEGVGQGSAS